MLPVSQVRGVLLDLDGVVYRGSQLLSGATEFFALLASRNLGYVLVTNNSTRTPQQVAGKLADLEIRVPAERSVTSALATAQYLQTHARPGARVYVVGEEGIYKALEAHGFDVTERQPQYVVVGLDRAFRMAKLEVAVKAIRAGAVFIATNSDPSLATERGLEPGTGALVTMIEFETDCKPVVIGKPARWLFEMAIDKLRGDPSELVMIGDNLETDIRGAQSLGLTTVLAMTGLTTKSILSASDIKPDYVIDDLSDLVRLWSL